MSNLDNLSPIDFEDLCRDLAQAETGLRFSAFGPGPDSGIDGRHSQGNKKTILQCKHYQKSSFSKLKASAKKEVAKLERLDSDRYLFITSQSLSPQNADDLIKIFGSYLKQTSDIWGKEDIFGVLRKNPQIEKSHIKLWLSSTAVLDRILQSGLEAFTHATKDEVLDEVKVYVRNPSFDEAIEKLEEEKILIVSGPPGVGKTTLAKMVAYNYLNDGWSFYAIRSLEEGFAKIEDNHPTVFFFDDFLGRIELDRQSLLKQDSSLATFVKRVRRSKNTRFILTTRAHIFEEARRLSDHVDDKKLQLAKYLLDVGVYTRKIKAHILFNHLAASDLSRKHFDSLLDNDWLGKIVDHKNYNPRIVAFVSSECIDEVEASHYAEYVYQSMEKPNLIWRKPFNTLNIKSQNLLFTLFFCRESGEEIDSLQESYVKLHHSICLYYNHTTKPNDFEEALHSLESGFLKIEDKRVSFINPSVRDFLKTYLIDKTLLKSFPQATQHSRWALSLWEHIKSTFNNSADTKFFALMFLDFAAVIEVPRTIKSSENDLLGFIFKEIFYPPDLSLEAKIELLFEWWEHSDEDYFLEKALFILQSPEFKIFSWRAEYLPKLHYWIHETLRDQHHFRPTLLMAVEKKIMEHLQTGTTIENLVSVLENINCYMPDRISDNVSSQLDHLISHEFTCVSNAISDLETEDELTEHMELLTSLAQLTNRDPTEATSIIQDSIDCLEEEEPPQQKTSSVPASNKAIEGFSDEDLKSLFSYLVEK